MDQDKNNLTEKQIQRKEYNKQYYATNKSKILDQLMTIVTCPNCKTTQTHQHLKRHMNSQLCKRRTEKIKTKK